MSCKRIAIHSVPRSGSTWLGNIFNSHPNVAFRYQPLFSYAFKDALSPGSSKEEILNFFQKIKKSSDGFINQEEGVQKGIIPTFQKDDITHICYKEVRYHHLLENMLEKDGDLKVIGLIRNPLAVIHSWLRAPKEFKKELGWREEEEWRYALKKNLNKPEEFNGYEKWKEVMTLFEDLRIQYPERFYLLNYDDILHNKITTVKDLFSFCDLNISQQTLDFIHQSSSMDQRDAYSVFKAKIKDDGWKKHLPKFIIEEITKDQDFIDFNNRYHWV
ncbi:sulfotransferase domain-containing protein [Sinomicrobium weinanense]|uniref:Sulfotransferase domain-containing protein n=1 Tax=Sinomicrobium weinanense TaxID=2842200 RepID=A0A926JW64_9FLAO|nr:sulfotransferase domain-containing protein [Sinomicrobium weinanense]MBC9798484.1 sulfotransferase domain-containing protein [Sinomicrobium weinanense]MBU3123715.1 sulfotransferase domain-containing protein [Sinomicrobium weinanense]